MSKRKRKIRQKTGVNRKSKDRLFNFIFGREENKAWTLELYNAVNKSDYKDPSLIRFNTLDDYLYVSMMNDTSFIFSDFINLYEHQSTYNPNLPLRMMQYLSQVYEGYIREGNYDKYGNGIIELPVPRLVAFYNGTKEIEDERIIRLSDAFKPECKMKSDVEVKVRLFNINHGHNRELMEACKPLGEYAWFVDRVKSLVKSKPIKDAIGTAIFEMSDSFSIKSFLSVHMSEVTNMLSVELQEKEAKDLIARANRKIGVNIGIDWGMDKYLIKQVCKKLKMNKDINVIASELEEDVNKIKDICDVAKEYAPDYDVEKIFEKVHSIDEVFEGLEE